LHRFSTALARDAYADGVLDLTIALEALLLPYDGSTKLVGVDTLCSCR
jgi:hypothetical protein